MTGHWDVRHLDPTDEQSMRRAWEIGHTATVVDRPYDLFWPWSAMWATASTPRADADTLWVGVFDGAAPDSPMVGVAQLQLPLADNTHLAHAELFVDPAHRRRGAGRVLVGHAAELLRERGRRTLHVEVYAPPHEDSAGLRFAEALGFTRAYEEGVKVADLQQTRGSWAALAAEVAPRHADYRLVTWWDQVPDHLVEGYAALHASFTEEAPMGDLEVEPEVWDEKRVRDREERFLRSGRHQVGTLAVAPDGTVVGQTEIIVTPPSTDQVLQGGTLVRPDHRGHGLGLAIKVANQQALLDRFPEARHVFTGNAGVNAPMNAVNDRLGFREVERGFEVVLQVGAV